MSLRSRVNEVAGSWASRRAARAAYRQRTLLVADHWEGSVQQFYHFLLGYLMPVALWLDAHPSASITLRTCGPMDPWIELAMEKADIELMPPGTALHMIVGDHMAHSTLKGMDDPKHFQRESLLEGAESVRRLLQVPAGKGKSRQRIIVIDRASSEDFYHGAASETHMSGGERRSTPNLRDITLVVPDAEVVDLARLEPRSQIGLMESTSVLVGQHGAGLVHMLWMAPGSLVIEIAPPLPPEVIDLFERLATCLGHRYLRIPQDTVHSDVDLSALAAAIRG